MAEAQKTKGKQGRAGRPSDFTPELGDLICDLLAEGVSLRKVCTNKNMPDKSTVFRWLRTHDQFRDQYTRAKEEAADALAEEIIDIADDDTQDYRTVKRGEKEFEEVNHEHINRSRLRIDTRKFLMAKMKPKRYGEKLDLTTDGKELPAPIFGGMSVKPDSTDETSASDA